MSDSQGQPKANPCPMTVGRFLGVLGMIVLLAGTLGFSAAIAYGTFIKMCCAMGVW